MLAQSNPATNKPETLFPAVLPSFPPLLFSDSVPLSPHSVAEAKFLAGGILSSESCSLCAAPQTFRLFRDTAGQERFKTITTAYYRGAMVRGVGLDKG